MVQPIIQQPFQQLTTARLYLRRFQRDDSEPLLAMRNDPEVARYQSWSTSNREGISAFIESQQQVEPGMAGEWFQFAVTLQGRGTLVGDCGLHVLAEDTRLAEIGYTFSRAFQGQGYATEAVRAMLDYAFGALKLHRISAICDVRNGGSIRVLERLGFRREGHTRQAFWNRGTWVDEYLYALLRDEWLYQASATATPQTKVVLLGTGTPNADPQRHGAAAAVVVGAQAYLVDAGPGIVRRAAAAAEKGIKALAMGGLTRLFLTHLHSDHTAGLADLILTPWVLERRAPLVIYGPAGTQAMVEHLLAAYAEDIRERREGLEPSNPSGYQVEVHEYTAGLIYRDKWVQVDAFQVQHGSWPAFGLRFTSADRTVAFSGDTSPFPGLAAHYQGCDVLVHEVYSATAFTQRPTEWQRYHQAVHTSTHELAALASVAQPGLLLLVHQLFWGTTEAALLAEIRESYAGAVVSGRDLDVY